MEKINFSGCGGVITKANQTISPPSTTNGYEHRTKCKWILAAPPGYVIQLRFSSFDLETNPTCRFDYVKVYDNIIINEDDAPSAIGKYCGSEKPPNILSTSRALTIVFKSDESGGGEGFTATYDFIEGRNCK